VVVNWLANYASEIAGVSVSGSRIIMSLYGAGAILCVPLTYKLEDHVKNDSNIVLIYSLVSVAAVMLLLLFKTPLMCGIFAMLIGIACEGGVMQLVLTIMTQFFPQSKGKCTGFYYSSSGLATFSIPIITGKIMIYGLQMIMVFDLIVALIALVLAIIIYERYRRIFG
jgi:Major Facilitator Superfamily.